MERRDKQSPQGETVSRVVVEFLDVAITSIVFLKGFYPPGAFERRRYMNVVVHRARHPQLREYIHSSVTELLPFIQKGMIERVAIIFSNSENIPVERFVFKLSVNLSCGSEVEETDLESLRSILIKLPVSASVTKVLPPGGRWEIAAYFRSIPEASTNKSAELWGCDGSILLEEGTGGSPERHAPPSATLKAFDFVEEIKEAVEAACPLLVSCADILVLATRDSLVMAGIPWYSVLTGRRDNTESYPDLALSDIPRPNGNISEILRLLELRGFGPRETVALLGAHNIGKIDCKFIKPRFTQPDPTLASGFSSDLKRRCQKDVRILSESEFGPKYYKGLMEGRGLLFADQQLMQNDVTAEIVHEYAEDQSGVKFRVEFAGAMSKMSNMERHVLTGSQGQVRRTCSRINRSNDKKEGSSTKPDESSKQDPKQKKSDGTKNSPADFLWDSFFYGMMLLVSFYI